MILCNRNLQNTQNVHDLFAFKIFINFEMYLVSCLVLKKEVNNG